MIILILNLVLKKSIKILINVFIFLDTDRSFYQQPDLTNMGSSNSSQKHQQQQRTQDQSQQIPPHQSAFVQLASEAAGFPIPPTSTTPQLKLAKTSQEKIDEISLKLSNLEKDVNNYCLPKDNKKDKNYLLLEESLTQCLLQLDEIDRNDDVINQLRRKLIGNTQSLLDVLESKLQNNNVNDNNPPENLQEADVAEIKETN